MQRRKQHMTHAPRLLPRGNSTMRKGGLRAVHQIAGSARDARLLVHASVEPLPNQEEVAAAPTLPDALQSHLSAGTCNSRGMWTKRRRLPWPSVLRIAGY